MRKVRHDAKLKSLPITRQAEVMEVVAECGVTKAAIEKIQRDLRIDVRSLATLAEFRTWYMSPEQRMVRELETAGSVTAVVMDRMRQSVPGITTEELFEFGQRFFSEQAIALQDPKTWQITQAAHRDRERVALKGRELELDQQRFQRETTELFIQWVENEQAKAIASSGATHSEKIQRLGQLMFGEGWR
jgi:hypothetical protein